MPRSPLNSSHWPFSAAEREARYSSSPGFPGEGDRAAVEGPLFWHSITINWTAEFGSSSTSLAAIRNVLIFWVASHSSRCASRRGLSPIECAYPSTSIAIEAEVQKKSRTYGPTGCCRRNLKPPGRVRSARQSRPSGSVRDRRRRRARATWGVGMCGMYQKAAPPPPCGRSPSPGKPGEELLPYALSLVWVPWTSSQARSKLIGRPNR
jgi:hypothetical protein